MPSRLNPILLAPALAALALSACATVQPPAAARQPQSLRVIGLNDFHGNLEPLTRPLRVVEADGSERQAKAGGGGREIARQRSDIV
ncbi:MAG: hypothetical protein ACO25F_11675, partial [Erythrobacter sp.]